MQVLDLANHVTLQEDDLQSFAQDSNDFYLFDILYRRFVVVCEQVRASERESVSFRKAKS